MVTMNELLKDYGRIIDEQKQEINKLKQELEECKKIIKDTLYVLPVGNINTHTPENIPDRVIDCFKEAADECRMREKWEDLADSLIGYAKEYARYLEDNVYPGNNISFASHTEQQAVSNVITQYEKLKNYE